MFLESFIISELYHKGMFLQHALSTGPFLFSHLSNVCWLTNSELCCALVYIQIDLSQEVTMKTSGRKHDRKKQGHTASQAFYIASLDCQGRRFWSTATLLKSNEHLLWVKLNVA